MKRKKLWLSLLLAVALLAAWFEPNRCLRGFVAGEPFYDRRPASYWAAEWEHWRVFDFLAGANSDTEITSWNISPGRMAYSWYFEKRDPDATPWNPLVKRFNEMFRPNQSPPFSGLKSLRLAPIPFNPRS